MNKIGTHLITNFIYTSGFLSLVLAVALMVMGGVSWAEGLTGGAPPLGTAEHFAVLGGQTVTNTGASVVIGHMGVSPGSAVTGFPPGVLTGEMHAADAVALQAQNDVVTAYNNLAGQACNTDLTGQDLGGLTLTEGVYCFSSSAQLTGQLTLDAQGDPGAVWIFQVASALNSASNSSVLVINGGSACNVFWQVGSSATLGTGNQFVGNILALTSISLSIGTNVAGRALAHNGAVTLDTNALYLPLCGAPTAITLTDVRALDSRAWLPFGPVALSLGCLGVGSLGIALRRTQQKRRTTAAQR